MALLQSAGAAGMATSSFAAIGGASAGVTAAVQAATSRTQATGVDSAGVTASEQASVSKTQTTGVNSSGVTSALYGAVAKTQTAASYSLAAIVGASSKVPGAFQSVASTSWTAIGDASAWAKPAIQATLFGTKTAESKEKQDGQ